MRILLAMDESTTAMDEAVRLTRERGAGLTALFVLDAGWGQYLGHDWLSGSGSRADFLEYALENDQSDAARIVTAFRQRAGDLAPEIKTVFGDPAAEILAELDSGGYDLLVMAQPFRRGLSHMRPVEAELLAKSPASILFVRG